MNKIIKKFVSLFFTAIFLFIFPATFLADDSEVLMSCQQEWQLEQEVKENYTLENLPNFSLTTKSYLTEEQLKNGLKGKLTDFTNLFITAEENYNINAIFLASLAAVESGWGRYPNSSNSLFGWTNGDNYLQPEDSILPTAQKIADYYLNEEGQYYEGTTIADVNRHYNGREEWEELIINMMCQIAEDIY